MKLCLQVSVVQLPSNLLIFTHKLFQLLLHVLVVLLKGSILGIDKVNALQYVCPHLEIFILSDSLLNDFLL